MDRVSQEALNTIILNHRKYTKGLKGGVRAVLKFKDLSGLSMRGHDMSNADFTGCRLDRVDLSGGNFRSTSFFGCDMYSVNMMGGDFSNCDFRGACIINGDLSGANMSKTDLRKGVLMSYADSDVIDSWGKSGETTIQGSVVRNTDLSGVRAIGTNFKDSNLSGVRLHEADLQGSNFEGANLAHADLMGSNLVRAIMKDVVVDDINLVGVVGNQQELGELIKIQNERKTLQGDEVSLYEVVERHKLWIDSNGADGAQLDVSEYDLSGEIDLKDYALTMIRAVGSKFTGLYLEGVKMESSALDQSDFRDCVAPGSDFRGSSFKETSFARADLRQSNFGSLQVKKPDGSEVMQSCDLSGARFAYSKLDGTSFKNANLSGVDFSYASLKGCDFTGCNLENAIFDNADTDDTTQMAESQAGA